MENNLPLSTSVLFYLAVFPALWAVSKLMRWLIGRIVASATRHRPKAPLAATQPEFSARVYETVTTRMA